MSQLRLTRLSNSGRLTIDCLHRHVMLYLAAVHSFLSLLWYTVIYCLSVFFLEGVFYCLSFLAPGRSIMSAHFIYYSGQTRRLCSDAVPLALKGWLQRSSLLDTREKCDFKASPVASLSSRSTVACQNKFFGEYSTFEHVWSPARFSGGDWGLALRPHIFTPLIWASGCSSSNFHPRH